MKDENKDKNKIETTQNPANEPKTNEEKESHEGLAIGMCLGMGLGMTVGQFIFQNMLIGMSTGMCLGMCLGVLYDSTRKKSKATEDNTEKNRRYRKDRGARRMNTHPVKIQNCPFCGGTEFAEGYQSGYGALTGTESIFASSTLYHIICRNCGSVVHSYVKNPEKILKWSNRR